MWVGVVGRTVAGILGMFLWAGLGSLAVRGQ
jgi:hypothetical protein